jgi:hypothetical protein
MGGGTGRKLPIDGLNDAAGRKPPAANRCADAKSPLLAMVITAAATTFVAHRDAERPAVR